MTLPVSVDSNITGLSFAEESSLKTLPGETAPGVGTSTATWYDLERIRMPILAYLLLRLPAKLSKIHGNVCKELKQTKA